MGAGGGDELVEVADDGVQRGVGADRHVGAEEVVVDRAGQADDVEAPLAPILGLGHAVLRQDADVVGPLVVEDLGAAQGAVAADHHQPLEAALQRVADHLVAPLRRAHRLGAGGAEDRPARLEDAADVVPAERPDHLPAVDQPLVALVDPEDLHAPVERDAHHRAQGRVHPGRVAAAGEDADPSHAPLRR